jgi:hypothetical protein
MTDPRMRRITICTPLNLRNCVAGRIPSIRSFVRIRSFVSFVTCVSFVHVVRLCPDISYRSVVLS